VRQEVALASQLLEVVFTGCSAKMLREQLVLLAHSVAFGLIPRIEIISFRQPKHGVYVE
jgi:hypothetical protein